MNRFDTPEYKIEKNIIIDIGYIIAYISYSITSKYDQSNESKILAMFY